MTTLTRTQVYRDAAKDTGTYDIYIEIDTDCQELLEAADMEYTLCRDDYTQNEIALHLSPDEFKDTFNFSLADNYWNEVAITELLLNAEMCEYATKVTIYKPNGDIISFR